MAFDDTDQETDQDGDGDQDAQGGGLNVDADDDSDVTGATGQSTTGPGAPGTNPLDVVKKVMQYGRQKHGLMGGGQGGGGQASFATGGLVGEFGNDSQQRTPFGQAAKDGSAPATIRGTGALMTPHAPMTQVSRPTSAAPPTSPATPTQTGPGQTARPNITGYDQYSFSPPGSFDLDHMGSPGSADTFTAPRGSFDVDTSGFFGSGYTTSPHTGFENRQYAPSFEDGGPVDGGLPTDEDQGQQGQGEDQGTGFPMVDMALDAGRAIGRKVSSFRRPEKPLLDDKANTVQNVVGSPEEWANNPVKRFMGYLTGRDAAPPEKVQAAEQATGQQDPNAARVQAVADAAQSEGPDAAWGIVQRYRQQADTARAIAAHALDQGSFEVAAHAATKMNDSVPNGQGAQFQAAPNGNFTVAVTGPDGSPKQYQLSREQMTKYLKDGMLGTFDSLMGMGTDGVLQRLSQGDGSGGGGGGGGGQPGPTQNAANNVNQQLPRAPAPAPRTPRNDFRQLPSNPSPQDLEQFNQGVEDPGDENQLPGIDPKVQQLAQRLFPNASDGERRNAFMVRQQQQNESNQLVAKKGDAAINAAYAKGATAREVANIRAGASTSNADTRANASRDVANIHSADTHYRVDTYSAERVARDIQKAQSSARGQDQRLMGTILNAVQRAGSSGLTGQQLIDFVKKTTGQDLPALMQRIQGGQEGQPQGGGPAPRAPQPGAPQAPAVGTVKGGFRFKGGDPSQQSSWEKM